MKRSPTKPSAVQGLRLGHEHGVDWDRVRFTPEALAVGAHHELEHTQSLRTAARIALDHLRERPNYYKKLEACMPEGRKRANQPSLSFAGREPLTGADVKKTFADNAAYKLLDRTPAAGSTWTAGGCWLLADALHALGGGDLWAVVDVRGVPHHVVVKHGDAYWDADGVSSEATILRRARAEGTSAPKLMRFTGELQQQAEASGIPAPTEATTKAILQFLRGSRKRNVPVPDELKKDVWYHGTPSEAAAKGILRKGLEPGHSAGRWAHKKSVDLSPLAGAVYLTRDESEAILYASGLMGAEVPGKFGYVFQFRGSDLEDVVPDEDYVAAAAWGGLVELEDDFEQQEEDDGDPNLRRFAHAVWSYDRDLGQKVAARILLRWPSARGDLEIGFRLPQWGKKALPLLSDKEKAALLSFGTPAAHFGKPLKPVAAWRFARDVGSAEERGDDEEDAPYEEDFRTEVLNGTSLRALAAEKIL